MTAWTVAGAILLALFLLSRLRLGVWCEYGENGLSVKLRLSRWLIRLYPPKKKREKSAGPKKDKPSASPAKQGGGLELLRQLLPIITEAAGQFKRKLCIRQLKLDLLWAGEDPAACAVCYGAANAAAGMILSLIEHNFDVRERRVRIGVDFIKTKPEVYLLAEATLRLGQLLALVFHIGIRLLNVFIQRKETTNPLKQQKEAV